MIEYIKGEVIEVVPAQAVIECNGIGYAISISLNTFSAIQGKKEVKLYIYEAIREDAHILYGFYTRQERELFLLLITVSGIGGNTARMILSALSPSSFRTQRRYSGLYIVMAWLMPLCVVSGATTTTRPKPRATSTAAASPFES